MRPEKRRKPPCRARVLRGFSSFFLPSLLALLFTAGCGAALDRDGASHESAFRESVYGEVVELKEATSEERRAGIIGWIGIEGARSQAVEEAYLAVRRDTRIIDRRAGASSEANLDAIALRQTVQASFDFRAEPGSPAIAARIEICP